MKTNACLQALSEEGCIPNDAEVVSTNNKLVVISERERTVLRIGQIAADTGRDDPHDLGYSHAVSWLAGEVAPVVRPIDQQLIIVGNYVMSRYPLMNRQKNLDKTAEAQKMLKLTGDALVTVRDRMQLRQLDIPGYVNERLMHMQDNDSYDQYLVSVATEAVDLMKQQYPFTQLCDDNPSLVHGDCKADNVVSGAASELLLIDLDAAAIGPKQYDLASWRLRSELGDDAPVELFVDEARRSAVWNEDSYRALIGWKALSSISFTLRYAERTDTRNSITTIANAAINLGGLPSLVADRL